MRLAGVMKRKYPVIFVKMYPAIGIYLRITFQWQIIICICMTSDFSVYVFLITLTQT